MCKIYTSFSCIVIKLFENLQPLCNIFCNFFFVINKMIITKRLENLTISQLRMVYNIINKIKTIITDKNKIIQLLLKPLKNKTYIMEEESTIEELEQYVRDLNLPVADKSPKEDFPSLMSDKEFTYLNIQIQKWANDERERERERKREHERNSQNVGSSSSKKGKT